MPKQINPIATYSWGAYEMGSTIGQIGSEEGVIIKDEELKSAARITLESHARQIPFAITCGIYGRLLHTHYVDKEDVAMKDYKNMKLEIEKIVQLFELDESSREQIPFLLDDFIHKFE